MEGTETLSNRDTQRQTETQRDGRREETVTWGDGDEGGQGARGRQEAERTGDGDAERSNGTAERWTERRGLSPAAAAPQARVAGGVGGTGRWAHLFKTRLGSSC